MPGARTRRYRQPIGGEVDGMLFQQAGTDIARKAFTFWQKAFDTGQ